MKAEVSADIMLKNKTGNKSCFLTRVVQSEIDYNRFLSSDVYEPCLMTVQLNCRLK